MNILTRLSAILDHLLNWLRPQVTTPIPTKFPVKTIVRLRVTKAPVVELETMNGELVKSSDIGKNPFKETLEEWANTYSLIYPPNEEWDAFWVKYKNFL